MSFKSNIKAVRNLLADESRWTKEAFAKDAKGENVFSGSIEACSWCLVGAVRKTAESVYEAERTEIKLEKLLDGNIPRFNDNATHAEILQFLNKVIENV